jgi:hypothetical protein
MYLFTNDFSNVESLGSPRMAVMSYNYNVLGTVMTGFFSLFHRYPRNKDRMLLTNLT